MPQLSRRHLLAGGACACALHGAGPASARVLPGSMQSLVGTGYRPEAVDEKGLWQSLERLEEELASSNLLLKSPEMHAYTVGIVGKLLGDQAKDTRIYLVQDASFNASMAPNGLILVNTGLLARTRDEAQYAAVLGHEAGHYLRRHSVAKWRDMKTKTGVMAFVSAGTNVLAGGAAMAGQGSRGWVSIADSINGSLAASIFSFSREAESEADAYGLRLIEQAGYNPAAASAIWQQFADERRASAAAHHKRYHDNNRSVTSTHPPTDERMLDLATSAREIVAAPASSGRVYRDGRDEWLRAVAPLRAMLLDEQVKQNDPGASLYLIGALAVDGWDGTLRYFEGEAYRLRDEAGDAVIAAASYTTAVTFADAPPEAWRAHGYALLKSGQGDAGRDALGRYLAARPDAHDAAMVRFSLN